MGVAHFFSYSPNMSTWESWNGNLILTFGQEPIPYNTEANWKNTAASLAQLATFNTYPIPDPNLYPTWQAWAHEFALIINGPSR